jgi:hypothetical protein
VTRPPLFVRLTLTEQEFRPIADGRTSAVIAERASLLAPGDVVALILVERRTAGEYYPLGSYMIAEVEAVDLEFLPTVRFRLRSEVLPPPTAPTVV